MRGGYGLTAAELPREFVSVTVTETTDAALPCTLKGIVAVNWLPNGAEAALWYQVVNAGPSGTVNSVCVSVEPVAAAKRKVPDVTSRGVE